MIIVYRILTIIIFLFVPLILLWRLFRKKEILNSSKDKIAFIRKRRSKGKLIWFHGASVGEIKSIIPLIEIYQKRSDIKTILLTSNTLSSEKILSEIKSKKIIHQFFPLDLNLFVKKFLNYWKPATACFVDSEIWPNMIFELKKRKIPILILNGRVTEKSFKKWKFFPSFSKEIFSKIDLCLSSSKETVNFLKKLGAKKVKFIGNLKFTQSEHKIRNIENNLKIFTKSKKVWCASSTHHNEEYICGTIHKKLKKIHKNLLTIIIPRHIERVESIKKDLERIGLNVHVHAPRKKINVNTDIYLVNVYGKTKSFYANCNNVFLGGSLVNHGGQNPLEAAIYGCNIMHGKYVHNFKEIYTFLKQNQIAHLTTNYDKLTSKLNFFLSNKKISKNKLENKLDIIGSKILENTKKELNFYLNK